MAQPQLCSLDDIKVRRAVSLDDAPLTDLIESVSDEIEDYVGAWLAPRPDNPATEATYVFDVERTGSSLRLQIGGRRVGIRSLSALGISSTGQPETGGTYTNMLASALLRPRPTADEAASSIVLVSPYFFTRGFNTVTATGTFGPAAVLPRVREAAVELVLLEISRGQNVTSESLGQTSASYPENAYAEILSKLDSLVQVAV